MLVQRDCTYYIEMSSCFHGFVSTHSVALANLCASWSFRAVVQYWKKKQTSCAKHIHYLCDDPRLSQTVFKSLIFKFKSGRSHKEGEGVCKCGCRYRQAINFYCKWDCLPSYKTKLLNSEWILSIEIVWRWMRLDWVLILPVLCFPVVSFTQYCWDCVWTALWESKPV